MSNLKGMRRKPFVLTSGEEIHIFSDANRLILQLRQTITTENDILTPSFKVAVSLTPSEALGLAGELLTVAAGQLARSEQQTDYPKDKKSPDQLGEPAEK